jgi:flagellar protein FlaI
MSGGFFSRFKAVSKGKRAYPLVMLRRPKHLIVIPPFKDIEDVRVSYPLIRPFASAEIKWIPEKKKLMYSVIEPALSEREGKLLNEIEEALIEVMDLKLAAVREKGKVMEYLQDKALSVLDDLGIKISKETYGKIMYYIMRDFFGMNEIEPMMNDPYIEDIGCNGIRTPVFIVHKKFGSIQTSLVYNDPNRLTDFVVKLSERCGRYISYAVPLLDGSLPDGSRVQASIAKDVTTRGPTFSIRKFRKNPYSPVDLIGFGTLSSKMMAYLWLLVQYSASILICGGVSTGKTTFLNVLSMFIPQEDKIISIEDTRELNLPHENWIPSVSRIGFGIPGTEGKRYGEVSLFDLLRESFRQNPDYVIVGEVRGREAYVMFQGIASGHPSMGTIHAGSLEDVMKRLETPPIELSPSLIESLDLLIILTNSKEKGKSARRVKEIVEIQSIDSRSGIAHTKESFSWIPSEDVFRENTVDSDLLRKISFQEGMAYQDLMKELEDRKRVLDWMIRHKVFQFDEICSMINLYYKDKEAIMGWVDKDLSPNAPGRKDAVSKAVKADKAWKPEHPPIAHKPDLSYEPKKPKIELREMLSKIKTKPFRIPRPEQFLKEGLVPGSEPARKKTRPAKPKPSARPARPHAAKLRKKARTAPGKEASEGKPASPDSQLLELKKLRRKIRKRYE